MSWISNLFTRLQRFANRVWYPPFIAFLAALDNLILIIPNDGILISSAMLTPKRWAYLAGIMAVGSTLGALTLYTIVHLYGMPVILHFLPHVEQTESWMWTLKFFDQYGLLLVFFVAATPVVQQPAIVLATLADKPLTQLLAVIFIGRLLKFLIMAYVGSHTPRLLKKMWGVKHELKEVGVQVEKIKDPQ